MITIERPRRRGSYRRRVLTGTVLIQVLEERVLLSLSSITVTPVNPSVPAGETEQFTATGNYTDGSTKDLTTQVTWASAATAVATISNTAPIAGPGHRRGDRHLDHQRHTRRRHRLNRADRESLPCSQSIAVTPANPSVAAGLTRAVHRHRDLFRQLDTRPDHPGDLGLRHNHRRHDLEYRGVTGPGHRAWQSAPRLSAPHSAASPAQPC